MRMPAMFKATLSLASAIVILATCSCLEHHGPGVRKWATLYYPNDCYEDDPRALNLDSSGNVYIASYFNVIKYNSDGDEVWLLQKDGTAAMTVDTSGNVYLTGHTGAMFSYDEHDFCTTEYDTDGNKVWEATFNGAARGQDDAKAIAVDGSGNVYVTGIVYTGRGAISTYLYDYGTVKYDSDGNQLWAATYDGRDSLTDWPCAIAIGSDGDVYVTGSSDIGDSYHRNYATVKYDGATGSELWVACYNGPQSCDAPQAIGIDAHGNVYVTGSSAADKPSRQMDFSTVKYDGATGKELWVTRYDGPAGGFDYAAAMVIDDNSNCIVTGNSEGNGTGYCDYATIKYDAMGNEVWVARYDALHGSDFDDYSGDKPAAMTVDVTGNVYVTGHSPDSDCKLEGYECATVKYDADGAQVWVARYKDPTGYRANGRSIRVGSSGIVYVAAHTWKAYATLAYAAY